eukprot:CAMPEP_0116053188 /NCGR_PEP_ID=MMETSP0322-20121206/2032_1 /TAXON_ID=163516 /ORGANISM="Leptocylindrus danicus var. apora, Strain B651" /LENGTH=154 /DNA_ID=CAMNT_0003536291 /DNA_START=276 /DNA_END=740 /DNA_ORIENTATION=-
MVTTRRQASGAPAPPPKTKKAAKKESKAKPKKAQEKVEGKIASDSKPAKEDPITVEKVAGVEETAKTKLEIKSVVVEDAKAEAAFKTRANKIVKGIGGKAKVVVNAEKPGKGNFIVRVDGVEEPVVNLVGMKRPFTSMKELDMSEVVTKILALL